MYRVVGLKGARREILAEALQRGEALALQKHYQKSLDQFRQILVEEEEPMGTLRLDDARKRTPPVPAAEAHRRQLATTLFETITTDDVSELAAKLRQMALSGDLRAMKMLLDLVARPAAAPAQSEPVTVYIDARTGQVVEPQVVEVLPSRPTEAAPGSSEKIDVMASRGAAGESLHHPGDAPLSGLVNGRAGTRHEEVP